MSREDDFVRAVLKMVMDATPSFSEEQAMQVEQQIRHDWGGEQVTIAKRGPLLCCAKKKVRAEIGLKSPQQLQSEHGISRATLYRWIGKKESGGG
jgi:hypothetical protein